MHSFVFVLLSSYRFSNVAMNWIPAGTNMSDGETGLEEEWTHPLPQDGTGGAVLKSLSLAVIIIASVIFNTVAIYTIIRDRRLHRSPYYFMINLSVADLLRSVCVLPFVFTTVVQGGVWRYGRTACAVLAFSGSFFTFGAIFALFLMATDRHMAIVHSRFHSRKFKGLVCLATVLIGWGLAFMMAFPPVFGFGTYEFIPLEAQCTYGHTYYKANDTLGYTLIFSVMILSVLFIYFRIFVFLRAHRKMRPVLHQPAQSDNWTFFGPGANGQAITNWLNGFARGPPNPAVIGLQNQPRMTNRIMNLRLVRNERLTRMFVLVTLTFDILWAPYILMEFWYLLDTHKVFFPAFITTATWLTYIQVAVIPIVYVICNKPFRQSMGMNANAYIRRDSLLE